MNPKRHVIEVVVDTTGLIRVEPQTLHMNKGESVFWKELAGKALSLAFEDPEAFRPESFVLVGGDGTGLIAHKVGTHPYTVTPLDDEEEGSQEPPTVPIIIIMDPSSSGY